MDNLENLSFHGMVADYLSFKRILIARGLISHKELEEEFRVASFVVDRMSRLSGIATQIGTSDEDMGVELKKMMDHYLETGEVHQEEEEESS
jgi:hypothetical protein